MDSASEGAGIAKSLDKEFGFGVMVVKNWGSYCNCQPPRSKPSITAGTATCPRSLSRKHTRARQDVEPPSLVAFPLTPQASTKGRGV